MEDLPTPTEDKDEEASLPKEQDVLTGPDGPFLSAGNRKAAKRTFPFDLKAGETIQLPLPQSPQAEDDGIPLRKRPQPGEPLPMSTDEANTEDVSHAATVALPPPDPPADATDPPDPPPDVDAAALDADSDLVMDTHPNVSLIRMKYYWTCGEEKKADSCLYEYPQESFSGLVPGRTKLECRQRLHTLSRQVRALVEERS
jgi:hypothetical protein